jgi:serine/threonine protein kinase
MEDPNLETSQSEIDLYNEQALLRYDFALEALLGCGGFGRVYRCRCLKSGAVVAIKVLSKADARRQGMQARVVSEVAVHSSLSHNNVTKLLDFFEDARRVFLVLDCASGGDVFRLVSYRKRGMSDEEAFRKIRRPASTRKSQQKRHSASSAVGSETRKLKVRALVDKFVADILNA